jgi:NADPH2:quinone reductase
MRAVVCRSFGALEALRVEECPPLEPGPGQVLVQVHAAGVNFTDLLAVEGRSQLKRQLPMIPGAEAAGIVLAVGAGVSRHRPGERVLGCSTHGTFAEQALFAEEELACLPDDMDMRTAAVFYIAAMTARYALQDRARLASGEILLVLGAGGGAGLAAVQVGKALGARVIAAASSREKCTLALAQGADEVVRYAAGPLNLEAQKALTTELLAHAPRPKEKAQSIGTISSVPASAGYHVILDGVGGTYTEPALRALGWEGRYLSIGFAAGMARIALGPALFRNADILCIQPSADEHRLPGRNPHAMQTLFDWHRQGKLTPRITQTLPLEQAAQALKLLRTRAASGRIVLTILRAQGRE